MGVQLTELLVTRKLDIGSLKGKVCAVDSSLWLYQFLTTIRQRDGSPLTDKDGAVTSHLAGLFSRTAKLMQYGIKLAFVFDGIPPALKKETQDRRRKIKDDAQARYEHARSEGDTAEMKKYSARTSRLTGSMVTEAKELVHALGLPVIDAPSEGEAQAAALVKKGLAYAVSSQDADCLLFGAPNLIRNLSLVGKKKRPSKLAYDPAEPQIISLSENLNHLKIDHEQLIALAMLIGTDYNPGGIRGIGPKNALKLVHQFNHDFDELFSHVGWNDHCTHPWNHVFYAIKDIKTEDIACLDFRPPDIQKINRILAVRHGFSEDRIKPVLDKLDIRKKSQKGLADFM